MELENTNVIEEKKPTMFALIALPTLIYGVLTTLFLYDNFNSITMPLFVILTAWYDYFVLKRLEMTIKKGSIFFVIGMLMLAISDMFTASFEMVVYNNIGIFVLLILLQGYLFYDQTSWTCMEHIAAFFNTLVNGIGNSFDFVSDGATELKNGKGKYSKTILYCLTGVLIFIPLGVVVLWLLVSADAIFGHFIDTAFDKLFSDLDIVLVPLFFIVVLFYTYGEIKFLSKNKPFSKSKSAEPWPAAVAITALTMINIIYICFSGIQIFALFLGKMALPEGYTYAEYAREGFFELLFVCFLNLCLVLFVKAKFHKHVATNILLTIVCLCTYIMIASSAMRMILYIRYYDFTVLRYEVLWALAIIAISITIVLAYIYIPKVKLFSSLLVVAVVGVFALTISRPEAIVANYNITHTYANLDEVYLKSLSADALPYIATLDDSWAYSYCRNTRDTIDARSPRQFNFSYHKASKSLMN